MRPTLTIGCYKHGKRLAVDSDIVTRLRIIHCAADDLEHCGTCLPCQAADEIERLRAAGDSMAKLLTRLPCSCVEGSNGEINETCEMCERFFHWQEVSRG
jgi:hypothetical protein